MTDLPPKNSNDNQIYANEISSFLPTKIFDAHTHIHIDKFYQALTQKPSKAQSALFKNVDYSKLKKWWEMLFPDSSVNGLLMGFPCNGCNIPGINKWVAEQSEIAGNCKFSILVSPDISANNLEKQIIDLKPAGLKPYMCFAKVADYGNASICDIIPEEQIELANKYGLTLTLHVAKPSGMADTDNLAEIKRLTENYPNCKFILAHCGRCFITPNMQEAVQKLPKADNLWIDTSAVCDIGVFIELFSNFELSRVLFGTDLVRAAGFRGSYIRLGLGWDSIKSEQVSRPGGQPIRATFAAYENLCALFHAARFCKVKDFQIEDIFYNNAAELFNINR